MSATDELRRLLDERWVKWTNPNSILRDDMTSWVANGFDYDAFEVPDGKLLLSAAHQDDLTPAQAIAATLGVTDATGERQADAVPMGEVRDFFYRCVPSDIERWRDEDFQRVAHFFGAKRVDA